MFERLKKFFAPKPRVKGRKRKFFAPLFSLLLLGNLFASHHQVNASEFPGFRDYAATHQTVKPPAAKEEKTETGLEQVESLWRASALLARPLLLQHEDCDLFQGKKKVGNFGVWWPKKINLPIDAAFRRYVKSEERIVKLIVENLGAGPEKNLTLYQMAQIYSFVYNTSVNSGVHALNALKTGGMKAAQAVMGKVDRVKGMKAPLKGLALRRKDEMKLGRGEFDIPISRTDTHGEPYTLAGLQQHYEHFLSGLGLDPAKEMEALPELPRSSSHHPQADEPAADPI